MADQKADWPVQLRQVFGNLPSPTPPPPSAGKRMFTMLRIVASYGKMLKIEGASEVKEILSEMRVPGSKPRTASPTAAQVAAIIQKADEAGGMGLQHGRCRGLARVVRPWGVSGTADVGIEELKRRKIAGEATTAELAVALAMKEVAPVADFERAMISAFSKVRARMRQLPPKLALLIIGLTDEGDIRELLRHEIDEALRDVGTMKLLDESDFQGGA